MSVVQTSEYVVRWGTDALLFAGWPYIVVGDGRAVDAFRTESAAEYAARLLNDGLATVNPHAVVGCRVEVK